MTLRGVGVTQGPPRVGLPVRRTQTGTRPTAGSDRSVGPVPHRAPPSFNRPETYGAAFAGGVSALGQLRLADHSFRKANTFSGL